MFGWIGNKLSAWSHARRLKRELGAESFRALAKELADLARRAEAIWPREHSYHDRIKAIQKEMRQLDRLASKPGFNRIPVEQRRTLRDNMLRSRTQLIDTVTTGPSPTSMLQ